MTEHVPPTGPPSMAAQTIARGGNVPWEQTFPHPQHGELTFRATLPKTRQTLRHQLALDEQIAELGDPATAGRMSMILAAALAGMQLVDALTGEAILITLPKIAEKREPNDAGGEKVTPIFYDAGEDLDANFPIDVWLAYSAWRKSVLEEVDAVKGFSGETSGGASDTPSIAPMVSPSTTPDS